MIEASDCGKIVQRGESEGASKTVRRSTSQDSLRTCDLGSHMGAKREVGRLSLAHSSSNSGKPRVAPTEDRDTNA